MPGVVKAVLLAMAIVAVYLAVGVVAWMAGGGQVCEVPAAVEVLNGCGKPGVADRVASHLRDRGFDVMYVGNADDFGFTETLVVDRTGDREKAHAVAGAMGRAPVVYQMSPAFFVDVTVVLGEDILTSSILADDEAKSL